MSHAEMHQSKDWQQHNKPSQQHRKHHHETRPQHQQYHQEHQPYQGQQQRQQHQQHQQNRGEWAPHGVGLDPLCQTRPPVSGSSLDLLPPRFGGDVHTAASPVSDRPGIEPNSFPPWNQDNRNEGEQGAMVASPQQQQQQQQRRRQKQRFIVKTHKPEAPDDQKRLIELLQQSVILNVRQISRANSGAGSFRSPAGADDEERIRTEISEKIKRTFEDVAAAQNDKVFKAQGLLKEAHRRIEILEKVIEDKDMAIAAVSGGGSSYGGGGGVASGVERNQQAGSGAWEQSPPKSRNFASAGTTEEGTSAALMGDMVRIKVEEGGAELIALSPTTLKAHLRLVLASQQRVADLEEKVTAAAAAAAADADTKQVVDKMSEQGMDVVMGETANASAAGQVLRSATTHASTLPTAVDPAIAPSNCVGVGVGVVDRGDISGEGIIGDDRGPAVSTTAWHGGRGVGGSREEEEEEEEEREEQEEQEWGAIPICADLPEPFVGRAKMESEALELAQRNTTRSRQSTVDGGLQANRMGGGWDGGSDTLNDTEPSSWPQADQMAGGWGGGSGTLKMDTEPSSSRGSGGGGGGGGGWGAPSSNRNRDSEALTFKHQKQHQRQRQRNHQRSTTTTTTATSKGKSSTRKHAGADQWRGSDAVATTFSSNTHNSRKNTSNINHDTSRNDSPRRISPASISQASKWISHSRFEGDGGRGGGGGSGGSGSGGAGDRTTTGSAWPDNPQPTSPSFPASSWA